MRMKPKTYIIAEAGVNHNGQLELAKQLVRVAAETGADAVKFQTFKAKNLVSRFAEKAEYQKETSGADESQFAMLQKLELKHDDHFVLIGECKRVGIEFLSTPFDSESLDFLVHKVGMKKLKIPSGEINNAPYLLEVARMGQPIILSTGMSYLGEVEAALAVLAFGYTNHSVSRPTRDDFYQAYNSEVGKKALWENVSLLHCTTEYPTPFSDVNLRAMDTLRAAFQLRTGLSDHTEGIVVPLAAVARGAEIIEKHFTLDKTLPGPDHKASLEPAELKALVQGVRQVEAALGTSDKVLAQSEAKNRAVARKSVTAAAAIRVGERFSIENLTIKRPGHGVEPALYWEMLGKTATRDYQQDETIETL